MFTLQSIGRIHSPYKQKGEAPRQGHLSRESMTLEVDPAFAPGLDGLQPGQLVVVLYWLDRAQRDILRTQTPFGPQVLGVFATRSPNRPNPIGLGVAELLTREGNRLTLRGLDALDQTPVLDIKPYIQQEPEP